MSTFPDITITGIETRDIRFPTTLEKIGSDAVNVGDYSAAYAIVKTSDPNLTGYGMTFTDGKGQNLICEAIKILGERIQGRSFESLFSNFGATWRHLISDKQFRWLGPERGLTHMALGALVNALFDLWARYLKKPVWQMIADFSPEEIVRLIDFRYITDALTPAEAIEILENAKHGKKQRLQDVLENNAVPAYTTSAGWLGYSDEKAERLLHQTIEEGYTYFKFKVGSNLDDDKRRLALARKVLGYDKGNTLMVDANQAWSVPEAIEWMKALKEYRPWFIEEPTSPDDILGHKAVRDALKDTGIKVATGEMCQNRMVFKQMFQCGAIDYAQIDACRVGGLNEVLAILLMAKKFNVQVVPHSGGVGLPEYTQHLSTINYLLISGEKSILEYVDHLHEHIKYPSIVKKGYYQTPKDPGYSVEFYEKSIEEFVFPNGTWWQSEAGKKLYTETQDNDVNEPILKDIKF
ncbi:hypothetical protein DASC09_032090 [Saccharomycopsis crataegensis]|uniref:Mandelate racemase/muconate lactonizing enzyme C-terminal domain-containing protein n=1 Tax=Saccharomycopsis crataegensis TaxID=43959 RepID=A0AAV5QMM1_9ASCO|nr:hypothetical protein DASC09_032090 [Saccharomycopsis crataegensis]